MKITADFNQIKRTLSHYRGTIVPATGYGCTLVATNYAANNYSGPYAAVVFGYGIFVSLALSYLFSKKESENESLKFPAF